MLEEDSVRGKRWVNLFLLCPAKLPSSVKDPASACYFVLREIKSAFVFKREKQTQNPHISESQQVWLDKEGCFLNHGAHRAARFLTPAQKGQEVSAVHTALLSNA